MGDNNRQKEEDEGRLPDANKPEWVLNVHFVYSSLTCLLYTSSLCNLPHTKLSLNLSVHLLTSLSICLFVCQSVFYWFWETWSILTLIWEDFLLIQHQVLSPPFRNKCLPKHRPTWQYFKYFVACSSKLEPGMVECKSLAYCCGYITQGNNLKLVGHCNTPLIPAVKL